MRGPRLHRRDNPRARLACCGPRAYLFGSRSSGSGRSAATDGIFSMRTRKSCAACRPRHRAVAGADAKKLLQGLITNDMDLLATEPAIHAALLSPQGKILFEFFVVGSGEAICSIRPRRRQRILRSACCSTNCALRRRSAISPRTTRCLRFGEPGRRLAALPGSPPLPIPGWRNWACALSRNMRLAPPSRPPPGTQPATRKTGMASHRARRPGGGRDYRLGDTFLHEAN